MLSRRDTSDLDEFLAELSERIRAEVASTPATLSALPLTIRRGKQLRSRLLWLSATAVGPLDRTRIVDLLRAAAAIELAHLGSLVHDDIVDDAETRRNVPTLHRTHGARAALTAGTTLLHLASALVAPFPHALRALVADALVATCRGQVHELCGLFRLSTPKQRLAIVRGKTSAFFELAAVLGTELAGGGTMECRGARRFARRYGVAFQTADDIADLVGDVSELGRGNGADLRDGVLTLPIIIACQRSAPLRHAIEELECRRSSIDLQQWIQQIVELRGTSDAAHEGRRWLRGARRALESSFCPNARSELEALAEHLDHQLSREPNTARERLVHPQTSLRRLDLGHLIWTRSANRTSEEYSDLWISQRLSSIHPDLAPAPLALQDDPSLRSASRALESHWLETTARSSPTTHIAAHACALARSVALCQSMRPAEALTIADCFDAISLQAAARASRADHARHEASALSMLAATESGPYATDVNHLRDRPRDALSTTWAPTTHL